MELNSSPIRPHGSASITSQVNTRDHMQMRKTCRLFRDVTLSLGVVSETSGDTDLSTQRHMSEQQNCCGNVEVSKAKIREK